MKRVLAALWLSSALISIASAQDASPPPPVPPAPPPLWSGKGELTYVATSGNTDTETLGAGIEIAYRPAPWEILFKSTYIRSEADGVVDAEAFLTSLRGGRKLTDRLELFVRGEYYENSFAGVDRRISGDAGVAYIVLPGPTHLLKVEGAFGYAREERVVGGSLSYPSARAGLLYEWKFSKTASFTDELSFTQNLEDSEDWILANVASLTADISRILALKVSYAVMYDNDPVPTFEERDTRTSAAIVAKF